MLSAGQRQRLGLARALFGRPRLLVLDEPNSNLDQEGEAALNRAIAEIKAQGTTVVLIAHRPSMLAHVDRILMLRNGAVEALGKRDEIMKQITRPTGVPRGGAGGAAAGRAPAGRGRRRRSRADGTDRPADTTPAGAASAATAPAGTRRRCRSAPPRPPVGRFVIAGVLIIALFFGGFGAWAGLAPLASAAVAHRHGAGRGQPQDRAASRGRHHRRAAGPRGRRGRAPARC